jgi:hypothetical protein
MSQFTAGKTYATRSVCDHDCIITVEYRFDPLRDIRPGEVGDHLHPRDVGIATIYTGGGDRRLRCGPNLTLYVGPTGVLFVEKSQGWATVDITATCQLKERS